MMYYCWDVFVLDCGDFTDMGSYKLCSLQSDVSTFQILSGSIIKGNRPVRDYIQPESSCINQQLLGSTSNYLVLPRNKARTSW